MARSKPCPCCGQTLPVSSFGRNRQAKDGLHYYCKSCAARKQRSWAKTNPAKIKEMHMDYLNRIRAANDGRDPYE